jgi:hypothetical protein
MKNPTAPQQAAAYINNESKHMTATSNGDEVILCTELGDFTLFQSDVQYLADKWKHKHAWYVKIPTLSMLAKACHEELEAFFESGDKTHVDNAEEGLAYLAERLQQKRIDDFKNDKL